MRNPFGFVLPAQVEAVFYKLLTRNDGQRHGVLVPIEAYEFLRVHRPFPERLSRNDRCEFYWLSPKEHRFRRGAYLYYKRYPERRISSLRGLNIKGKGKYPRLFVMGRYADFQDVYEIVVLGGSSAGFKRAKTALNLPAIRPGIYGVDPRWKLGSLRARMPRGVRAAFRTVVENRGKSIPAVNRNAGAVGETFEALCGIARNNRGTGDLYGVELKASVRRMSAGSNDDLFLKEPHFVAPWNQTSFLSQFGYIDSRGRRAFKASVSTDRRKHGLRLKVDDFKEMLFLINEHMSNDRQIAAWRFAALETSLSTKLRDTIFITASEPASGRFRYEKAVWCSLPSLRRLVSLIRSGEAWIEFRMHRTGRNVRNHGTQFRIRSASVPRLFASSIEME